MTIKLNILLCVLFSLYQCQSFAQDHSNKLLNEPSEWRFERIDFPLEFAPELDYKGFEELRFAPGMFDTSSTYYFTYLFAISLEPEIKSEQELKDFLYKYYWGLAKSVAESKKLIIDLNLININLIKRTSSTYNATILFLDSFNEGQSVDLNLDIELINKSQNQIMLVLVSPHDRNAIIWKELNSIKENMDW